MVLQEVLGVAAILIGIISYFLYSIHIFSGKTKTHAVT